MNKTVAVILMMLILAGGFAFYRASSPNLVWDDTNWILESIWAGQPDTTSYWQDAFSSIGNAGYRPLNTLMREIGRDFFLAHPQSGFWWFLFIGFLLGATAFVLFFLSRRYTRTDGAAVLAVFFIMASSPFVSSLWVVFSGVQILVSLMIASGLLFYERCRESSRPIASVYGAALFAVMFLGPWYREFTGVLPVLIVILEIQNKKRITGIMALASMCLLHAMYPMALVKFLFFRDLPLAAVAQVGLLGQRVQAVGGKLDLILMTPVFFEYLKRLGLHLYSLLPPLLWLTAMLGAGWGISKRLLGSDGNSFRPVNPRILFLSLWFALTFSPFLVVFTEQVHLGYCLVPLCILLAVMIENLFLSLQGKWRWIKILMIVCLAVAAGDQALNVYGSQRVVSGINDGILTTGRILRDRIPPGSAVVCNALHGGDIELFSGSPFEMFWSVRAGVPWTGDVVEHASDLAGLKKEYPGRDIYFLDMDYDFLADKTYHRHKFVHDPSIPKKDMGRVYEMQVRYPFWDPLKHFVARSFISFLGPPDLENDFYRGPCRDQRLFCRETSVVYHLYEFLPEE